MNQPILTTLDEDGWEIDDGEVAHAESPDTYWIPPLEDRQSIQPGSFAKLRFFIRVEGEDGKIIDFGERMWVQVLAKTDDWYQGKLANQPSCTQEIQPGLDVWFQPRHVINIQEPE